MGSLFRQAGSLIRQSLRSFVSGNRLQSCFNLGNSRASLQWLHQCCFSPILSAKFKTAVSHCAAATDGRYLPQCAVEVHYHDPHQRPFKFKWLLKGGAGAAGTGGQYVSHWFESLQLNNAGQTQASKYAGRQMVQCVVQTVQLVGQTRICTGH